MTVIKVVPPMLTTYITSLFILHILFTASCCCLATSSTISTINESRSSVCNNINDIKVDITDNNVEDAEHVMLDFINTLKTPTSSSNKILNENFHIHGWRWHTMSLIHESRRLHQSIIKIQQTEEDKSLVQQPQDDQMKKVALQTVVQYVVDFNMRGLHRIENDIFFPTIQQRVRQSILPKNVISAFTIILHQFDTDRNHLQTIGSTMIQDASIVADTLVPKDTRARAMAQIAINAETVANSTNDMLRREESIIIPTIAHLLSEQEQKSINNLVIRKLGILDSRLHLVGMYEAIHKNLNEIQVFQKVIPLIPQKLISRWQRTMYEPRAGALDKILQ